ncbi:hypothetical protein HETIRDRAFT_414464 [Heterobasidion irregulare TC 32-1]|uniref:Uncharacterized protein n=1 Tax=Heterobasidion irregulare (strain TC 32-1) TaxID=747525 RepID=W4KIB6_HETIT|nr:uncharacterized protein HETIRDRAFT_414464 [Heterobasidion irregulare TC 32-1]ETW85449.1 hypothetical protein HETIRDRAFT_414464 [Heterobasidion irregulare TC 32-1]
MKFQSSAYLEPCHACRATDSREGIPVNQCSFKTMWTKDGRRYIWHDDCNSPTCPKSQAYVPPRNRLWISFMHLYQLHHIFQSSLSFDTIQLTDRMFSVTAVVCTIAKVGLI